MVITVFDTETTSLTKPFCYNIGYIIVDTETGEIYAKHDYVVEQIWHNMALFSSAYYAEKREIYVKRMRGRVAEMKKYGHICQKMLKEFERYGVQCAYAYNSAFDDKVFQFNCDWYKCNNPFDNIPIIDIRGAVHQFLIKDTSFLNFCEQNKCFTDSGNYSTTAETVYQFITNNSNFVEEHTALSDSEIEFQILEECVIHYGAEFGINYQVLRTIPRDVEKELTIITKGETDTTTIFRYKKKLVRGDKIFLTK